MEENEQFRLFKWSFICQIEECLRMSSHCIEWTKNEKVELQSFQHRKNKSLHLPPTNSSPLKVEYWWWNAKVFNSLTIPKNYYHYFYLKNKKKNEKKEKTIPLGKWSPGTITIVISHLCPEYYDCELKTFRIFENSKE